MTKRKIGLLIIHGIGEQGIYDTLDVFTRNLVESLHETHPSQIRLTHHRMKLADAVDDSIKVEFADDPSLEIDIHEYYWAQKTERMISFQETMEWLLQASNGAQDFYSENEELSRRYETEADGQFPKHWYLKRFGFMMRALYLIMKATSIFIPGWADSVLRVLMAKGTEAAVDYLGDVAVYTSTDQKSKFYAVRQSILGGAADKLGALLQQDYDRILIVGHSLGSVIAYDALNQLNLQMNEQPELAAHSGKLFELVTIGSPLDKVAFFFRDHIAKTEYVKQLILGSVNGFRRRGLLVPLDGSPHLISTVKNYLEDLDWTNYWDENDPVSGHLDFYDNVLNVQVDNQGKWGGEAHNGYWQNLEIYREVINRARAVQPMTSAAEKPVPGNAS